MAEQLALMERDDADFRLDARTRQIGKAGVAEARRVLREVVARAAAEAAEAAERAAAA